MALGTEMPVTPGGGARHLAWHPSGKFCYVNEESGGVITSYAWDATAGTLQPILFCRRSSDVSGIIFALPVAVQQLHDTRHGLRESRHGGLGMAGPVFDACRLYSELAAA